MAGAAARVLNHVCGDSAPAYGAVTGFVTAGPVGAIVGGAVGYAGSSSDVGPPSTWYLSKVGGAVACAAFVVAGPVTAVAAGAAAVGGAYFVKLPYVDKLAIGRQAAHVTKEMALQISALISDLTTPRLTVSESETAALEVKRAALAAKADAAMMEDNFALRPLNEMEHAREWRTLEHLLGTDPKQLGKGKDAVRGSSYSALRLAAAWHIDNPAHRIKYEIARGILRQKLQRLERKGLLKDGKHRSELPTMSGSVESLGGLRLEPPEEDCNETLLLHGTNEANLWSILSNGLNERYSGIHAGAAFGEVRLLMVRTLPVSHASHAATRIPPPCICCRAFTLLKTSASQISTAKWTPSTSMNVSSTGNCTVSTTDIQATSAMCWSAASLSDIQQSRRHSARQRSTVTHTNLCFLWGTGSWHKFQATPLSTTRSSSRRGARLGASASLSRSMEKMYALHIY